MKVLHLTTHLNMGGITSYIYRLARGLQKAGIETQVASGGGDWEPEFFENHIHHFKLPLKTKSELSPKLWISFLKLKKLYRQEKWDLIHANTRVTKCLAHVLSHTLGIPYVTTIHGFHSPHLGRKIFPCLGHKTISISQAVEKFLKTHYPMHSQQITTIHHGLAFQWFDPNRISTESVEEFKKQVGLKSYPIIGNFARLSHEKGHIHLLDVVKYLWDEKKMHVQLLIMGDGREKEAIEKRISDLNLKDWVILLPSRKHADIALVCASLDIFVSYHVAPEGFGFSLLEAMAMGKPVVSRYLAGGISDFLEHGKEGFLLKGGSIEQFSEKVYELLMRHDLRKQFGEAASKKVTAQFSYETMVRKTLGVYQETVKDAKI